ncbi:MAG: hypothetical protein DCE90_18095 [Pseudanabaena sp.]|nr:MAG: hypothetical protein DCE90_18095 [Pseudanabaena sp.]
MALYSDLTIPANIDPTPSNNGAITNVTVGTSSQSLIAANPNRQGFSIFNNSNRIVYLGINSSVSATSNYFARIPANGLYEWTLSSIYRGAIFAIANGTNAICQVLETTP